MQVQGFVNTSGVILLKSNMFPELLTVSYNYIIQKDPRKTRNKLQTTQYKKTPELHKVSYNYTIQKDPRNTHNKLQTTQHKITPGLFTINYKVHYTKKNQEDSQ